MEAYQGVAILTTNSNRHWIGLFNAVAFTVNFPFPDCRATRGHLEPGFRRDATQGLLPKRLAQLNMAGGNIRNIAVNAAFLAAEAKRRRDGTPAAGRELEPEDRASADRGGDLGVV